MAAVAQAMERVVTLPGYQEAVLSWAPAIAARKPGPRGVFLGYDFHPTPGGPRLIEINTNAGGALVNAAGAASRSALEQQFLGMFEAEWACQEIDRPLRTVAIVDDDPFTQFLCPEFVHFKALFERAGLSAIIAGPEAFVWRAGRLWYGAQPIDLIYNRLTDFSLDEPAHAALRLAYEAGAVALTPHPYAHALYADKRNLTLLGEREHLVGFGLSAREAALLSTVVPRTVIVEASNADQLWRERRRWFFKPARGYGSRGAYRGAKLTRRVWDCICSAGDYVAQTLVPPGRLPADGRELSYDLRCYVYAGQIQLMAARLYRGQTTNFRTPGGGFAAVEVCDMPQFAGASG
jgi:hypothetical protein